MTETDPQPGDRPGETGSGRARRPLIERVGLAVVALFLAALFGGVGVAAWVEGEMFLATMGALGCLMTVWVGGLTLLRG